MKTALTIIGFILFVIGFLSLILSLVGLKLSYLTWIDSGSATMGLVYRLLMIFGGISIVYVMKMNENDD